MYIFMYAYIKPYNIISYTLYDCILANYTYIYVCIYNIIYCTLYDCISICT